MYLNGVMLVSTILNFQGYEFEPGNDLPYITHLPTYAATAWYHKKLGDDLQQKPLVSFLEEVEQFALGDYTLALMKGAALPPEERAIIVEKLARYTGLSADFIERCDLRVEIFRFTKELLRDQRRTERCFNRRHHGHGKLSR